VGYPIYIAILVSAVTGLGTGALLPFRKIPSLTAVIPRIQKRLALISVLANFVLVLISGYGVLFSNLSMAAY
jgi:hypothetical protein